MKQQEERASNGVKSSAGVQFSDRQELSSFVTRPAALLLLLLILVVSLLAFAILRPGLNGSGMIVALRCGGGIAREQDVPISNEASAQHELLERLYNENSELPDWTMRRAQSNTGSPERLQRFLHKLLRGEPITIATVGGSVTAGQGARRQSFSYRERLFRWIRRTFPHPDHVFHNGALSAAPSSYMSQCIHDYAPIESDLVFVEFTMNDRQDNCDITTDGRRAFELLLRKILKYPKAPAVVVLHWWSPLFEKFEQSAEDHLEVFTKFYGLPSLSWRDAMHGLIASNTSGFSARDLYFDKVHPNGYNGHRYFADIITSFLRQEAAAMVIGGLDVMSPVAKVEHVPDLPQPMLPGNYEGKAKCLRDQELQDIVAKREGWQWKNDGSAARPKWGFISTEPGSKLTIKVSTHTYRAESKIVIGVGILMSYAHMGQAQLTCVSGCECDPVLLDGHWKQKTSQKKWVYAAVTQHRHCEMVITNMNATSSGEHKVFVNSFLVTNQHASGMSWFNHIDDLKIENG